MAQVRIPPSSPPRVLADLRPSCQRVKPPAVKPEQTVSLETSLKTVNVLLETAVGCITYLRCVLPSESRSPHGGVEARRDCSLSSSPGP